MDAIRYLVKEGISWRAMPADFPPWPTVFGYLHGWQASGATERMHGQLRDACRTAAGRKPGPTAAVIGCLVDHETEITAGSERMPPHGSAWPRLPR